MGNIMQVGIQSNEFKPMIFNMSKDKVNILLKFIDAFTEDKIDESSDDYKNFISEQIDKSLKTRRVNSGNSIREII